MRFHVRFGSSVLSISLPQLDYLILHKGNNGLLAAPCCLFTQWLLLIVVGVSHTPF